MKKEYLLKVILSAAIVAMLASCGSIKQSEMLMLQNMQSKASAIGSPPTIRIQADDILNIQVASRNPETVAAFQVQKGSSEATSGERALGQQEGYRVDETGNIYLPFIGRIYAAGKTVLELREEITTKLVAFFPDVTVQVRYQNFRVTLVGEVTRPNAYIIPNEHLNILEAIGMAGDFTPYARRNSVLVMRERNQKREFGHVNMQDSTLFKSPYFYLSPNDIVYVEPLKAKQYATQGDFLSRYSPVFLPVVSLATFVLSIVISTK